MKKLMVSTIILLPLLILVIMLVSGAIMSLVTHIYVESVEFVDNETLVLVLSDEDNPPSQQVEVNVLPLKATNRDLEFGSDNNDVVTINENGVVTARNFGETYVSVKSRENKAAAAKRKVLVTDNTVHSVKILPIEGELYNNDSKQLQAVVMPAEANDQRILWNTNNPDVLSVSLSGEITCHKAGVAVITASSVAKPDIQSSITVTCHQQLSGISAQGGVQDVFTSVRNVQFPNIIPTPADATYTVKYTSSDDGVATVDAEGNIAFKHAGFVTVTATAEDVRGNSDAVSVNYSCADGYFTGSLFERTDFTLDYDNFAGGDIDDVVRLLVVPELSYREIISVSFDRQGLLAYDDGSEKFSLLSVDDNTPLGKVQITVEARKYNTQNHVLEIVSDICTVDITRKARSISFVDKDGVAGGQTATQPNITFEEANSVASGIGVAVSPANHTDLLDLRLTNGTDIAQLQGAAHMGRLLKTLAFSNEGEATVEAFIVADPTVANSITISYIAPRPQEKTVEVGETAQPDNIVLNIDAEGNGDTCSLVVNAPAGKKAEYRSDDPEVIDFVDGTLRLAPKKGGFATVTVTFVPEVAGIAYAAADGSDVIVIKIYVDKAISANDVTIKPLSAGTSNALANGVTQNKGVDFVVTLAEGVEADAFAGKKIAVDGVEIKFFDGDIQREYKGHYDFPAQASEVNNVHTLRVAIGYDEQAKDYDASKTGEIFNKTFEVRTTRGNLTSAPEVKVQGGQTLVAAGNAIKFDNIGAQIVLEISIPSDGLEPSDFVLTEEKIAFAKQDHATFVYQKSVTDSAASVTLTATCGGSENAVLSVAGHNFGMDVTAAAPADFAKLEFKGRELISGQTYGTLLKNAVITFVLSRTDGEAVTDKTVEYFVNNAGDSFETADVEYKNGRYEGAIEVALAVGQSALTVRTGDGVTASVTIDRKALSALEYKQFYVQYPHGDRIETLDAVDFGQTQKIFLPKNYQGSLDVCVDIPMLEGEYVLEGFDFDAGSDMSEVEFFTLACPKDESWNSQLTVVNSDGKWTMKYGVSVATDRAAFVGKELTFACGGQQSVISLNCVDIAKIFFTGFDSDNKANGGDIYKGFQQVRVFAKHSYYDGIKDYFRMPVTVLSDTVLNTKADAATLTWKVALCNSEDGSQTLLVSQTGDKVTYGGAEYTIVKGESGASSKLQDAQGKVVAQNGVYAADASVKVPWVDVYVADGFADVYFGDVKGLSEVDVQNDYFGNFGEEADWARPQNKPDDGSKRDFQPSEGAFTFIRVEAGDGVEAGSGVTAGVNAHFNFNIIDDNAAVNVFDAAGYYANKKIVLHNNLYGGATGKSLSAADVDESAPKGTPESQFIRQTTNLDKDLIYGNGNAICYNARNEDLKKTMGQSIGNYGGVSFGSVYNVTLRGRNPSETFNEMDTGVVFVFKYCYYSDIQHYYKASPYGAKSGAANDGTNGGLSYFKNSVISKAIKGIQLYYSGATVYFENMMIYDCIMAVCAEGAGNLGGINGSTPSGEGHNLTAIFQGDFNDVLNYQTIQSLTDAMSKTPIGFFLSDSNLWKQQVAPYAEWFGKKGPYDMNREPVTTQRFINPVVFACFYATSVDSRNDLYDRLNEVKVTGFDMKKALDMSLSGVPVSAWIYNYDVMVDGGASKQATDRDMSKLFTPDRYIRVLCEYKNIGSGDKPVKNDEHILWHRNQVYRKTSLVGARLSHIDDLKASLVGQGIQWPDGTTPEQAASAEAAAIKFNSLLSTVIPVKREEQKIA